MDRTITATVDADPATTLTALADLGTYPEWLPLVAEAEAVPPDEADSPAWSVTLRAKVGPFARSKRLRMRRVELGDREVRFERAETDGRDHAAWLLDATVSALDSDEPSGGTEVTVRLRYDGAFWSAPIEQRLAASEADAAQRLGAWLRSTDG